MGQPFYGGTGEGAVNYPYLARGGPDYYRNPYSMYAPQSIDSTDRRYSKTYFTFVKRLKILVPSLWLVFDVM